MREREPSEEALRSLAETGSQMVGGAVGGVTGALIWLGVEGPVGAVLSGASGPVATNAFIYLANEFRQRLLGKREEQRIGATIVFAGEKIRKNRENGQQIRTDGFFEDQPGERSAAKEIFEGVLLAAQREHQEKKLRFYGNLVANIAFDARIGRAYANLLTRLGNDLSYRQMCLLALFYNREQFDLRREGYRGVSLLGLDKIGVLQEINDLYSRGMLSNGGSVMLGPSDAQPSEMFPQGTGVLLYELMELWEVGADDLDEIAALLQ